MRTRGGISPKAVRGSICLAAQCRCMPVNSDVRRYRKVSVEITDAQAVLAALLRYGIEAVIAGGVVFLLVKHFLPGYLSEKGKNLATREDIAKITNEIEQVRSQYAVLLEELKAKHQLRLAAIDRRLAAHQEAFALWRQLMSATHTTDVGKHVMTCQAWWENNCLYLEPSAREAFSSAYAAAHIHSSLIQNRDDAVSVKENWSKIMAAGSVILQAAQLPGLTSTEQQELQRIENEAGCGGIV